LAHRPIITLTTDFGLNDHFVGTIKGVILSISPEIEIVDISHSVQAFDVLDGALTIAQAYSYFPSGTVHLVVVDPGVGTARRPILVSSDRHHFVAPDNGVLSMVYAREERLHIRHVTAEHYSLQPISNTFHARDIFAPVAAWLAKGVDAEKFGDEITDFVGGVDKILVRASGFGGGLTVGGEVSLVSGSDPTASGTTGQFLFDTDDGRLLWDEDGSGAGAAVLVATFSNLPTLTTSDFAVV